MVDIINRSLSQIFVHQQVKYKTPEALARTVVIQSGTSQSVSLSWVDKIVFKVISPPFIISELLAKDFVEGKLHVSILFAEMDVFKHSIYAEEEKIQVPVLDESPNKDAKYIAEWLKRQTG
jgi:hypothetical protein